MKRLIKKLGVVAILALCGSASATILINEIDSDTPGGDKDEFVELKGAPNESANGLILVFFLGTDGSKSYRTVDLTGLTCDSNGYILLADARVMSGGDMQMPNGFIKNTECAVALYADSASSFPDGTLPTSTNLQDVIVYRAISSDSADWSGFGGTNPVYLEGTSGASAAQYSLSRVPDSSANWVQSPPTPRAANYTESLLEISNTFITPRFNQQTAQEGSPTTVTLKNVGPNTITVSTLELATTSSAQFSTWNGPVPALPVTLGYNEEVALAVQLLDTNPDVNRTYNLVVNYVTDSATSPSGSFVASTELVRATVQANVNDVVVNEVCYMPGSTDHNNDGDTAAQNDEFVELYNTTASPIVIEGWEQRCENGADGNFHSFIFPAGTTIPANGFVTVFTSGTPTGFVPGTTFVYGIPRISNQGAFVGVSDGTKLLDGLAYGNAEDTPDADDYTNTGVTVSAGSSIGRRPDGADAFRAFVPNDVVVTDRPSPNLTNGFPAAVSDWAIY